MIQIVLIYNQIKKVLKNLFCNKINFLKTIDYLEKEKN